MQDELRFLRPVSEQTDLRPEPMVSVAITSYKSRNTIARAIESVLMQTVAFAVEIVVGDDCSPDDTLTVVDAMARKHPGVIRVMARSVNLGIQRNYHATFSDCRGKYIAWLDADDWWTAPEKLQRQVEALEADPTIMICGHFVRWITADGEIVRPRFPEMDPGRYGLTEILASNFLPSPSVLFRRGMAELLPEWYFDAAPLTDWPLHAIAAQHGQILLLDGVFADYHLTPNSNFWGQGESFWYRLDARFYDLIHSCLSKPMQRFVREQQAFRYERLAYYLRKHDDYPGALDSAWSAVRASPAALHSWKALAPALANRIGFFRRPNAKLERPE